jgi:hypothetical protein
VALKKIPVGKTIAFAYQFTFANIGTVIGLIWLPLVVYSVANFFATAYYMQGFQQLASGDPSALGRPLLVLLGFAFLAILIIAMIGVSLTRQALGVRTTPSIVNFGLGVTELNLFLSLLAAFVVLLTIYMLLILVRYGVAVGLSAIGPPVKSALASRVAAPLLANSSLAAQSGLDLIVVVVFVYLAVRLCFMLAAVTVAEGQINLIRAWTLTRGNFWRIFAIGLATVVPIAVVGLLGEVAILGPESLAFNFNAPADSASQIKQLAQQTRLASDHLPWLLGLGLLLGPFTYGLVFSAPAFAYRAIANGKQGPSSPDMGPLSPV